MDILPDGSLDYDDDFLADMDFVIASIHSSFSQPEEVIMERLENALNNQHVDLIAHPTGRLIGRRDGYALNIDQLIELAKNGHCTGTQQQPVKTGFKNRAFNESKRSGCEHHDQHRCTQHRHARSYGRRCHSCKKGLDTKSKCREYIFTQ